MRTNKADTRFGPVVTYRVPFCAEHPLIGIGGGSFGRLDIALQCVNQGLKNEEFVTQSEAVLSVHVSAATISNTILNRVKFVVTDAGDAVVGARVFVAGRSATTNAAGSATIFFPKHAKPGRYPVTASAVNYFNAHGTLVIVP